MLSIAFISKTNQTQLSTVRTVTAVSVFSPTVEAQDADDSSGHLPAQQHTWAWHELHPPGRCHRPSLLHRPGAHRYSKSPPPPVCTERRHTAQELTDKKTAQVFTGREKCLGTFRLCRLPRPPYVSRWAKCCWHIASIASIYCIASKGYLVTPEQSKLTAL